LQQNAAVSSIHVRRPRLSVRELLASGRLSRARTAHPKTHLVGFESDEIADALNWLDGVAAAAQARVGEQHAESIRVYAPAEQEHLGEHSIAFIAFLESAGVLPPAMREMVIDRASAIPGGPLDLEDLKIIVLMVFWSLGEEPDALILDELFVAEEDRLIH
jgi:Smg protein